MRMSDIPSSLTCDSPGRIRRSANLRVSPCLPTSSLSRGAQNRYNVPKIRGALDFHDRTHLHISSLR